MKSITISSQSNSSGLVEPHHNRTVFTCKGQTHIWTNNNRFFSGHLHAALIEMMLASQPNPSLLINQGSACQQCPLHLADISDYCLKGTWEYSGQRDWGIDAVVKNLSVLLCLCCSSSIEAPSCSCTVHLTMTGSSLPVWSLADIVQICSCGSQSL